MRIIFTHKQSLLVGLLVELELIQLDSLLLSFVLEFPKSFKGRLRLSLSSLDFFTVFNDRLSELLSNHTFDNVLTVSLARWSISEEIVLGLLTVEDLDFDLLQRVRKLNVASLKFHEVSH